MKKYFLLVLGLFLVGCGASGEDDSYTVVRPQYTLMYTSHTPTLVTTGTVQATREIDLTSKISGRIEHVFVSSGDQVTQGDKIVRFSAQNDQSQTAYTNAVQTFETVKRQMNDTILEGQTALKTAQLEADQVQKTHAETVRQQERSLRTKIQQTTALVSEVLTFLDMHLQVTDHFDQQDTTMGGFVGWHDAIGRQDLLNATRTHIAQKDVPSLDHLERGGEERLLYLKTLQDTFLTFDTVLKKTRAIGRYTEAQKTSLQTVSSRLIQRIHNTVLDIESSLQAYKSAQENAELAILQAKNRVRNAEEKLSVIKSHADSSLQSAQNRVNLTNDIQTELVLRSPFSGVVVDDFIDVGQLVQAGMPLVKLADVSAFQVEIQVAEKYASILKHGHAAEVFLEGYPQAFSGHVTHIDPAIDPQSRKLIAEVTLINPPSTIKIGGFARVQVSFDTRETFFVPSAFVGYDKNGAYIVTQDHQMIRVRLGDQKNGYQEIQQTSLKPQTIILVP